MTGKPVVAITVGDPGGIGPEITAKALALPEIYDLCKPLVVTDMQLFEAAIKIAGKKLGTHSVKAEKGNFCSFGTVDIWDMQNVDLCNLRHGEIDARSGRASYEYIAEATRLALDRHVDAIVTGPIHKKALNLAGYPYAGHTEIIATLTGAKEYCMLLVDGSFRVSHVTTHIPLSEVSAAIKQNRVLEVLKLTDKAVKKLCGRKPNLGVAGLNPHGGDEGLFGREEIEEIGPAIEEARRLSIDVEGPISPDTVFVKMRSGLYDGVVAMYHDQGHIPIKLQGFHIDSQSGQWSAISGVNVTLGLPIIRTSVDHGVAFGKAGKGTANAESMIAAIKVAVQLIENEGVECLD